MGNESLNIYQRLAIIGKSVDVMKKNTKAYGYNYVREEDILTRIKARMEKQDVSLIPQIVPGTLKVIPYTYGKTKAMQNGTIYEEKVNEVLISADMVWRWICNDNPKEYVDIPWGMVGQQSDASQSFGSGLTYSSRYFLLKYFNVATSNDDPDKLRSDQKKSEAEMSKLMTEEIIEAIDSEVRGFLGENPGKSDEVKKFMSEYVKEGNYKKVTEPRVAGKILSDFKEKFGSVSK